MALEPLERLSASQPAPLALCPESPPAVSHQARNHSRGQTILLLQNLSAGGFPKLSSAAVTLLLDHLCSNLGLLDARESLILRGLKQIFLNS